MMNLWIYGDSFAHEYDLGWAWHDILADRWAAVKHNHAFQGTSQIWSINQMMLSQSQWQPGDRVIWLVTHPSRYWYHPTKPDISGAHISNLREICQEVDRTGTLENLIHLHGRWCQHPALVVTEYAARLAWACSAADHSSVEMMILQCFGDTSQDRVFEPVTQQWRQHVSMPLGDLMELSKSEVAVDMHRDMFMFDPRAGHFSRDLHADLADFLDRHWLSKSLDLADIYRDQPTITRTALRDKQFVSQQFQPDIIEDAKAMWRTFSRSR